MLRLLLLVPLAFCGALPPFTLPDPPATVSGRPAGEDDDGNFRIDGKEDLPNFQQVSKGIYRSGQPNAAGLEKLAGMGVRTILSLRYKVSDEERREAKRLGIAIENIPIHVFLAPSFSQMDRAVAILSDPAKQPVLVHCRYGRDRTGFAVAAWRVTKDRMDVKAAAEEAYSRGCCPPTWKDLEPYLAEYARKSRGDK